MIFFVIIKIDFFLINLKLRRKAKTYSKSYPSQILKDFNVTVGQKAFVNIQKCNFLGNEENPLFF